MFCFEKWRKAAIDQYMDFGYTCGTTAVTMIKKHKECPLPHFSFIVKKNMEWVLGLYIKWKNNIFL